MAALRETMGARIKAAMQGVPRDQWPQYPFIQKLQQSGTGGTILSGLLTGGFPGMIANAKEVMQNRNFPINAR